MRFANMAELNMPNLDELVANDNRRVPIIKRFIIELVQYPDGSLYPHKIFPIGQKKKEQKKRKGHSLKLVQTESEVEEI